MHQDQKYIEALLNNDAPLIDELYKKHAAKIKGMVIKNNGNEDDARDLMQDALLDIYRSAKKGFVLTCPLDAFLYKVCRNKWITILNKRKMSSVTFMDTERYNYSEDTFSAAEKIKTISERKQLLAEKLLQLSDSCRQILRLCWSGKSMGETAKILNITYAYARKRKSECQGKLTELVRQSAEYKMLQW